jgi:hypothetical protein
MMADSTKRDGVFLSYSHLDSGWLDKVRTVLDPDVRNGRIQYFDDRELEPGDPWYKEFTNAIDHAKVAVLLVSPNFFASRFIAEDELPRILRAVDDGLTILWVPLSGKFYGPDAIPGAEKLNDRQAVWDASETLDLFTIELAREILIAGVIYWSRSSVRSLPIATFRRDSCAVSSLSLIHTFLRIPRPPWRPFAGAYPRPTTVGPTPRTTGTRRTGRFRSAMHGSASSTSPAATSLSPTKTNRFTSS